MATLILAGGRSSRMGRDKALIPIHGVPMIRRVYDVAVQCCPPVYVITPWSDRYRPVLPNSCRFISESTQQWRAEGEGNRLAGRPSNNSTTPHSTAPQRDAPQRDAHHPGPLVGFYQGFRHILTEQPSNDNTWLLLLACDLPSLQPDMIKQWQTRLATAPPSTIAALTPHPTKGWQSLCGFYHPRCLPSLAAFLSSGGRSFQQWLRIDPVAGENSGQIQPLPCANPTFLFNCNSPGDLATLTTDISPSA